MSVEIYFVNKTKKQIVSSKRIFAGFELSELLLAYLSCCVNDSIKIVSETDGFIEDFLYDGKHLDYKYINLFECR